MDGLTEMWITDDVVIVPVRKRRKRRAAGLPRAGRKTAAPAVERPGDLKVFMVLPTMRALFSLLLVCCLSGLQAQLKEHGPRPSDSAKAELTPEEYIDLWKPVAMDNMKQHGIPASITLAQGLLESRNGNSDLARQANNHFGIKCTSDWTGGKTYHDDDKRNECFRKYNDAADSFEDHSKFLQRQRYADLFTLRTTDYRGWAHGLKKAGYATDPRYPQKLIDLIERYELYKLDEGVDIAFATPLPGNPTPTSGRVDANEGAEISVGGGRLIELFEGRIKFIRAKNGDTYRGLANAQGMMPEQLARYNDTTKDAAIAEGQVVYLQPKRARSRSAKVHVVRQGDTLWSISQQRGVKMDKLATYNGITAETPLVNGQQLLLQKPRKK